MQISGIWAALYTPLDAKGNFLKESFQRQIELLLNAGISGVVLCGTTGEFPYLSPKQRIEIGTFVRHSFPSLPLIIHVSDFSIRHIENLVREAEPLEPTALMLLPPLYFPASQEDIIAHYSYFSQKTSLPFILYDFPKMTNQTLSIESLERILDLGRFLGIKQSASDPNAHDLFLPVVKERNLSFLSGQDLRCEAVLRKGVDGFISGLAHPIPEWLVGCCKAYFSQNDETLSVYTGKIDALASFLTQIEFPLNIAACLQARGWEVGACKKILAEKTEQKLDQLIADLFHFFKRENLTVFKS